MRDNAPLDNQLLPERVKSVDQTEGGPMDQVTREYLDSALEKQKKSIKEHTSLLIEPIIKDQEDFKTILVGVSRMNGLVGRMKTVVANLKAVYALLGTLSAILIKLVFFTK